MSTQASASLLSDPRARIDGAPRNRLTVLLLASAVGLALAVMWSYTFVDHVIGGGIADTLLGQDAREMTLSTSGVAILFAFVSGVAGTFTACNIAVFSSLAPMSSQQATARHRLAAVVRPIGWLALGTLVVSATYGAAAAAAGPGVWQLSRETVGGLPVRLIQASVIFGVVGLIMIYFGLAALDYVPNPLRPLYQRYPHAELLVMGGLIGLFLVGRPFPLFIKFFAYAAERRDPFFGALSFALQALGNIVFLAVAFGLLTLLTRGRLHSWLAAVPGRAARLSAAAFLVAGIFMVVYWDLRLPAMFGYGWFPTMPWN